MLELPDFPKLTHRNRREKHPKSKIVLHFSCVRQVGKQNKTPGKISKQKILVLFSHAPRQGRVRKKAPAENERRQASACLVCLHFWQNYIKWLFAFFVNFICFGRCRCIWVLFHQKALINTISLLHVNYCWMILISNPIINNMKHRQRDIARNPPKTHDKVFVCLGLWVGPHKCFSLVMVACGKASLLPRKLEHFVF